MNVAQARFVLGIAIPASALVTAVGSYLLVRGDLPDRLATHFDASGTPDGSMTHGGFLTLTVAMVVGGSLVCILLARTRSPHAAPTAPLAGFLGAFFASLGASIATVTFLGQRGLRSWTDADGVWLLVGAATIASIVVGALGARAASELPATAPGAFVGSPPTMSLAQGQNAVWVETMHSPWLGRLGAALSAVGVVLAFVVASWLFVPTLLVGLVVISLSTLHVRADRSGLHVKYGLLPWPRTHVPIADIAAASVIDVRPMQWGGWGYRGSLKLMKQAAVVHRAGPGIRLDLRGGKVFVITVDDPATPAALLNAEVARIQPPTDSATVIIRGQTPDDDT